MSIPENAKALKAAIPYAVQSCAAWLQERLAPLTQHHGAIDAIAILSKATTGDAYCFPVSATDDGVVCGSRSAAELPAASEARIWLGYGRVYGDRTDLRVIDPMPFHGWGEHTAMIAEMMKTARVTLEEHS